MEGENALLFNSPLVGPRDANQRNSSCAVCACRIIGLSHSVGGSSISAEISTNYAAPHNRGGSIQRQITATHLRDSLRSELFMGLILDCQFRSKPRLPPRCPQAHAQRPDRNHCAGLLERRGQSCALRQIQLLTANPAANDREFCAHQ